MRLVSHIKVRYEMENALLFFSFELLGSNLLRGIIHSNRSLHSQDAEFDLGESLILAWFDCDGRTPICKTFSGDGDLIRDSRRGFVKCKGSIVLCDSCETIARRPLKDYCGGGNRIAAGVDHHTPDASCFCFGRFKRLCGYRYCEAHYAHGDH